jgi:hypothetical protein
MIRHFVRWVFNLDILEQLEGMQSDLHQIELDRDRYSDNARSLSEENIRLQKTIALQRSLIGILRDVNRELDERNVSLEKRTLEDAE